MSFVPAQGESSPWDEWTSVLQCWIVVIAQFAPAHPFGVAAKRSVASPSPGATLHPLLEQSLERRDQLSSDVSPLGIARPSSSARPIVARRRHLQSADEDLFGRHSRLGGRGEQAVAQAPPRRQPAVAATCSDDTRVIATDPFASAAQHHLRRPFRGQAVRFVVGNPEELEPQGVGGQPLGELATATQEEAQQEDAALPRDIGVLEASLGEVCRSGRTRRRPRRRRNWFSSA